MKGFKYNKFKAEANGNDSWGSYSDLFMVVSFVFLMMYVVASLRSGTNSIQERLERQKVNRENDDLRAQMKAYDTLKDSALKEESKDEQEVYGELMDKLTLLQDQAKDEKDQLRRQANENEKKEMALNRYQQVVRNIINANMLAKNKLKVREEIIEKKNETIVDLNQEIKEKKEEITQNNKEISKIHRDLAKNISDLTKAQQNSKISKEKAYKQIAMLKQKSQQQIEKLNEENREVQSQVAQISQELSKSNQKVAQKESENQKLSKDLATTSEKLEDTVEEYEDQMKNLQRSHAARMAQEKSAFENKLKTANLTAKEKAKQLEEFNRKVKEKDAAMSKQIASLQSDLEDTQAREAAKAGENQKLSKELAQTSQKLEKTVGQYEGQIKEMQNAHNDKMGKEKAAFESKIAAANMSAKEKANQLAEFNRKAQEKDAMLGREIEGLKGSLADAQARANARAKLSKEIAQALKNAGVEADVNPNTGDVTISFGKDFFDSGSAQLKGSMAEVLRKFVPKYSESLFKDKKIAEKITSVEIVGFASPTYKGKYIDPLSLNSEDQKAAKYNLDLSFQRARSIFDYMFDTKKIEYSNQKQLLSLVKVSGRSFFTEGRSPAGVTPGMDQKEFCKQVDCKKAQKVIIKFNMDDKK
jgi:myosin heavy subunit